MEWSRCRFIAYSADVRVSWPSTDLPLRCHLLLSLSELTLHIKTGPTEPSIYLFWDG